MFEFSQTYGYDRINTNDKYMPLKVMRASLNLKDLLQEYDSITKQALAVRLSLRLHLGLQPGFAGNQCLLKRMARLGSSMCTIHVARDYISASEQKEHK